MCTLYQNILSLCNERGIKPGKMCSDTGISRGLVTDLKMDRKSSITVDTAQKIADYFGVSVDRVLGTEQKEKPTLQTESELDPVTQEIFDMMKDMSKEELLLLKARAEKIKESR